MSENSVVLPAPLRPSKVRRWPRPIASETSRSTSRPPNAWLTPATTRGAAAFCAVIGVAASMAPLRLLPLDDDTARPSWPHDHAPGLVADRHRLDDTEIRHVDHRHIVADAIGRIEAALVAVEGEGPDALPDQEIFLHLVGLRIDHGNTGGRPQGDEGELAGLCPRHADRPDRLLRHGRHRRSDLMDDLVRWRIDDADRAPDLGCDPDLLPDGLPFRPTHPAVDHAL